MKKRELREYREKSVTQLEKDVEKMRREYLEAKLQLVSGEAKDLKKAKRIRRDIAQILGIIGEPKEETK